MGGTGACAGAGAGLAGWAAAGAGLAGTVAAGAGDLAEVAAGTAAWGGAAGGGAGCAGACIIIKIAKVSISAPQSIPTTLTIDVWGSRKVEIACV